ncbi:MAG: hypothetical protein QW520_06630 [Methanomassiliicoccales archaeon]
MNEKDVRQMRIILDALNKYGRKGAVLLDVPSTQFVRVNLMLLRALSQEKGLSGIFVSVDRPHQYMVHLLSMHQIRTERLMFIDAISRFSADFKIASANVDFLDGPFHIDRLPSALAEWGKVGNGCSLKLSECGFAIIDNLSALLTYNSYTSVEAFLRKFVGVMEESGDITVPLVIDSEKCGLLYETAKQLCIGELRLKTAMLSLGNMDSNDKATNQVKGTGERQ